MGFFLIFESKTVAHILFILTLVESPIVNHTTLLFYILHESKTGKDFFLENDSPKREFPYDITFFCIGIIRYLLKSPMVEIVNINNKQVNFKLIYVAAVDFIML